MNYYILLGHDYHNTKHTPFPPVQIRICHHYHDNRLKHEKSSKQPFNHQFIEHLMTLYM